VIRRVTAWSGHYLRIRQTAWSGQTGMNKESEWNSRDIEWATLSGNYRMTAGVIFEKCYNINGKNL